MRYIDRLPAAMRDSLRSESWHVLQDGAVGEPTLCVTSMAVFDITRNVGPEFRDLRILCGQTVALPSLSDKTRVGFLGSATYPDTLVYLGLKEIVPNIVYVGVSDELLVSIGASVEAVSYEPDADELQVIRDAILQESELEGVLGGRVTDMIMRRGRFVANPLPWCFHNGRLDAYMRAVAAKLRGRTE